MKQLILILAIAAFGYSTAQTGTYPLTKKKNYKTYVNQAGKTINIGDTITINQPKTADAFTFITQGNQPAAAFISGDVVTISKLKSIGNKTRGYKMYAYVKGYGLLPVMIDLDQAINAKEITL